MCWVVLVACAGQSLAAGEQPPVVSLLEYEGTVEYARAGSPIWDKVLTNNIVFVAGDRLRTSPGARAILRFSEQTSLRLGPSSVVQIPEPARKRTALDLLRGVIYFFHRDQPGIFPIGTPVMSAVVRGTEFNLEVSRDGTSNLLLIDGQADLSNEFGPLTLVSGDGAITEPGKAPARTAVLRPMNIIQWALYYPGILNLDELPLSAQPAQSLEKSLAAYRAGDLLAAWRELPGGQGNNDPERIYMAAVSLAVGEVSPAETLLNSVAATASPREIELRQDLHNIIAVVRRDEGVAPRPSKLSTSQLALSYSHQAKLRLPEALAASRKAVQTAPDFGFGWARVAELEFGFGHRDRALSAVETSLRLAPRNAQAHVTKGFLLVAENKISDALQSFQTAIDLDGGLGNAWLGKGLSRIRAGDLAGGREDLQTAALLEPQSALFRSYLGKAWSETHQTKLASREIDLAKKLDPNDPTAWLYSALLKYQQNRINEAIEDLQQSQARNENRAVYRSQSLLDQDRAVRGVNLAQIYQDAGMEDVALWEASRAVSADYANYSAHLFLANSYQRLREDRTANLRYESAAINEYLLSSLLAPVGAGTLAQSVSPQEYSRLFERDGFGFYSSTEYLSRGAWREAVAQYGRSGNLDYSLSAFHIADPGQRSNNDLKLTELSLQLKYQLTSADSVYFRAIYDDAKGGNLAQVYDPATQSSLSRFKETQEPLLLAGYHHEWGPGNHTLFLAGRLQDTFRVQDPEMQTYVLDKTSGHIDEVDPFSIEQSYRSEFVAYTAELQQIWQQHPYTVVAGARYQWADIKVQNLLTNANLNSFANPGTVETDFVPPSAPRFDSMATGLERISLYGYLHWEPLTSLRLIGGVSYDRLTYPVNFRFAPTSAEKDTNDQLSPKGGIVWTPTASTTVRGAYSRSLGGVSFEQSFRLEPVQVAGFNQTFRSIIPESVTGANANADFESWGVSVEQKVARRTYVGVSGEILNSEVSRLVGAYDFSFPPVVVTPSQFRETLKFQERTAVLSARQLIGKYVSAGASYRISHAQLTDRFPEAAGATFLDDNFQAEKQLDAVLQQVNVFGRFNHSCGFFGVAEALWTRQSNRGYVSPTPGDEFWQFNLFAGYRFPRRQAELSVGLLNVTDQDYRLNPLNLTTELPRSRTLAGRFTFYF